MKHFIASALALVLLAIPTHAQDIILGTVTSVVSEWQSNSYGDTVIMSKVKVRVDQSLRGQAPSQVEVTVPGGTIDGITLGVSSQDSFSPGDKALVTGKHATKLGGSAAFTPIGHVWGTSQVRYLVNPDNVYVTPAQAVTAVQFAAGDWNTQGQAGISLAYGGLTGGGSLTLDRVNNVFFRQDSSGYIAETYWWWDGTGHLVDADIVFHENYAHCTHETGCNGGYFIENTGTHEFGHMLGLNHSTDPDATMAPTSGTCETSKETLGADDIAGIQSLYPLGGPGPKPCHGKKCR